MLAIMIGKADISGRLDCCRSNGMMATRRSPSWPASISGVRSDVLMSGLAQRGTSLLDARVLFRSRMSTKRKIGFSRHLYAARARLNDPLLQSEQRAGG